MGCVPRRMKGREKAVVRIFVGVRSAEASNFVRRRGFPVSLRRRRAFLKRIVGA